MPSVIVVVIIIIVIVVKVEHAVGIFKEFCCIVVRGAVWQKEIRIFENPSLMAQ